MSIRAGVLTRGSLSVIHGEELTQLGQKLPRAEWLCNIANTAGLVGLSVIAPHGVGGHSNDGYRLKGRVSLNPSRCLIPIEFWELNVHQNQIRSMGSCHGNPLFSGNRFDHF